MYILLAIPVMTIGMESGKQVVSAGEYVMEYRAGISGVDIHNTVREVCDGELTDSIIPEKVFHLNVFIH